jgi:predicted PurR-regulated permease PerM
MTATKLSRRRHRRVMRAGWLDFVGAQAWALIGIAAIVWGFGFVVGRLGWFLMPAAFAMVFGILAAPLVTALERRNVHRLAGTAVVFAGIVVVLVVLAWIAIPPFVAQASRLVSNLPDTLEDVAERVAQFEKRVAATNPAAGDAVAAFEDRLRENAATFADGLSGTVLNLVVLSFQVAAAGLLGAVIAFLAVKDLPAYSRGLREWLDQPANMRIAGALRQMSRTATSFVRGQLFLALIVGVLSGAALGLLGVPYFLPLGAISAVGELIPTVGPILAAIPAVILAASEGGAGKAVAAGVALLVVQQFESYVIVPRVVASAVELSPLVVIVTLTLAGGLLGLGGLLVAIPLVAVVRDGLHWFFLTDDEVRLEFAKP